MSGRISIVTVCLNQVDTIEAAMRSVLDQPGDPVEYIVIDGGSTDGTVDVIRQYADRLAYWVSESDRGQSHALNKGLSRVSGDIIGWLNADDLLESGRLDRVRDAFERGDCDVLCGACRYEYPDGTQRVDLVTEAELAYLSVYDPVHQPSCFWRRDWHERVGGLDETLEFGMDWDLWLRLREAGARFAITNDVLSIYRVTGTNKTSVGGARRNRELYRLLCSHSGAPGGSRTLTELAFHVLWPLKRMRRCRPSWLFVPLSNALRTSIRFCLGPVLGADRIRRCTHPFS